MRGLRGLAAGFVALAALAPAAAAKPGDLIVGDTSSAELLRVKPNGDVRAFSNDPDLDSPTGSTFSASNRLFAADYDALGGDGAIFKLGPFGGVATPFEDDATFSQPIHVDYHPNGFVYAPDYQTDVVARVNPATGGVTTVGDFSGPALADPISIAVLPNGSMVVGQNVVGGEFLRVRPNGAVTELDVSGDPIARAYGIAADAKGRVLIADSNANAVLRMVPRTGRVTRLSSGNLITSAMQPAELPNGKIALANGSDGIVVVNPASGNQRYLVGPGEIGFAEGISVEPPKCFGQRANIVGTRKPDKLRGSRFKDVIVGLGGDDVIRGFGAKDRLCGKAGDDVIRGGRGRDRIRGGAGNDDVRR